MNLKLLGGSLAAAATFLCPLPGNASTHHSDGDSSTQSLHAKTDQQNGCDVAGRSRSRSGVTALGFLPDENVVCADRSAP